MEREGEIESERDCIDERGDELKREWWDCERERGNLGGGERSSAPLRASLVREGRRREKKKFFFVQFRFGVSKPEPKF